MIVIEAPFEWRATAYGAGMAFRDRPLQFTPKLRRGTSHTYPTTAQLTFTPLAISHTGIIVIFIE